MRLLPAAFSITINLSHSTNVGGVNHVAYLLIFLQGGPLSARAIDSNLVRLDRSALHPPAQDERHAAELAIMHCRGVG